jgi:hypothetical protein
MAFWMSLVWVSSSFLCAQSGSALPQPDVVFYGRVTTASGGSEVVPTSVAWTMNGNAEAVTSTQTQIVSIDAVTYYITRLPFEVRRLGNGTALTATVGKLALTRPDTAYARMATVDGNAAILPAGKETLTYGVETLGLIERIDLMVGEAESYAEWAARTLGDANADPEDDPDGDGLSNGDEFRAGTDPTTRNSTIKSTLEPQPDGDVRVKWPSVAGKRYRLERATDLTAPEPWTIIADEVLGTGEELQVLDDEADAHDRLFYRLSVDVPENGS